jgi:hypothetical protein
MGPGTVVHCAATICKSPTSPSHPWTLSVNQNFRLISLGSAPNELINFHVDPVTGLTVKAVCIG